MYYALHVVSNIMSTTYNMLHITQYILYIPCCMTYFKLKAIIWTHSFSFWVVSLSPYRLPIGLMAVLWITVDQCLYYTLYFFCKEDSQLVHRNDTVPRPGGVFTLPWINVGPEQRFPDKECPAIPGRGHNCMNAMKDSVYAESCAVSGKMSCRCDDNSSQELDNRRSGRAEG